MFPVGHWSMGNFFVIGEEGKAAYAKAMKEQIDEWKKLYYHKHNQKINWKNTDRMVVIEAEENHYDKK